MKFDWHAARKRALEQLAGWHFPSQELMEHVLVEAVALMAWQHRRTRREIKKATKAKKPVSQSPDKGDSNENSDSNLGTLNSVVLDTAETVPVASSAYDEPYTFSGCRPDCGCDTYPYS